MAVAVVVAVVPAAPAASLATVWTRQATPNPTVPQGQLAAVSCPVATHCVAVGSQPATTGTATVAETLDGTTWALATPANVAGSTDDALDGLSCPGIRFCVAVGSYRQYFGTQIPLAETFDGTAWKRVSAPNPAGATNTVLSAVSCASATFCVAVGSQTVLGSEVALAEIYDGSTWKVSPTADLSTGTGYKELVAVSCPTRTFCAAAGSDDSATSGLIEAFDGTSWTNMATAGVPASSAAGFAGISCPMASACTAVGTYYRSSYVARPLAETFDGTAWSYATTPSVGPGGLDGVSCATASSCLAVGTFVSGAALAETRTGTTWTTSTPIDPSDGSAAFAAVACPASKLCVAVGSYQPTAAVDSLAETYSAGTWTFMPTPDPAGSTFATLAGVSCPIATFCMAVGQGGAVNSATGLLTEIYSGGTWSIVTAPNPGHTSGATLDAVSCVSVTFCVAVGSAYNLTLGAQLPLAETYNGSAWTITAITAPVEGTSNELVGVSCPTETSCVAVGSSRNAARPPTQVALAEIYTSGVWTLSTPLNPPHSSATQLAAVSCAAAGSCEAVGSGGAGPEAPLAEAFNGTAWSIQTVPNLNGTNAQSRLTGVSCPAATACEAVGSSAGFVGGPTRPLAVGFDGTTWTSQTPQNASGGQSALLAVSCPSSGICTTVGLTSSRGFGATVTVAESFDGSKWSIESSPTFPEPSGNPPTAQLTGVSCPTRTDPTTRCTAVGFERNPTNYLNQTLVDTGPI